MPWGMYQSACSCLRLCLLSASGCDAQWCAQTAPKCGSFEGAVQGAVLPAISTVLTASDNGRTPLDALSEAVPSLLQVSSLTVEPQHSRFCCARPQKVQRMAFCKACSQHICHVVDSCQRFVRWCMALQPFFWSLSPGVQGLFGNAFAVAGVRGTTPPQAISKDPWMLWLRDAPTKY